MAVSGSRRINISFVVRGKRRVLSSLVREKRYPDYVEQN
jgi:hypothetical protein